MRMLERASLIYRAVFLFICISEDHFQVSPSSVLFTVVSVGFGLFCTYNSLGNANVVCGSSGGRLIRSSGVSQNGQLLGTTNTALAQTAQLDPVGTDGLVSGQHKVVTFAWEETEDTI